MRSLEINKQEIWYALYQDKVPVIDENNDETGDYRSGYDLPQKFKLRVGPNKGESNSQMFGVSLPYDRVMSTTDKSFPIDEFSILWIDKIPTLESDGSYPLDASGNPITGHDYTVARVAKDINVWSYAIKKVN